ncbi:hypothetical protein ACJX0J_022338 [Zea mays]
MQQAIYGLILHLLSIIFIPLFMFIEDILFTNPFLLYLEYLAIISNNLKALGICLHFLDFARGLPLVWDHSENSLSNFLFPRIGDSKVLVFYLFEQFLHILQKTCNLIKSLYRLQITCPNVHFLEGGHIHFVITSLIARPFASMSTDQIILGHVSATCHIYFGSVITFTVRFLLFSNAFLHPSRLFLEKKRSKKKYNKKHKIQKNTNEK